MSKMKANQKLFVFFLFLFFCGLVCKVGAASVADKCSNDFTKVVPCLDFAKGTANTPTKECCTAVKDIRNNDPVCLCYFIQQTHNGSEEIKSLGIKEARLLQLPSACSLKNASISDCPSLLGLSPNSPDAAIFANASTATPTATTGASSSAEKANNTSNIGARLLGPNWAGPMAMALAIFIFGFPVGSAATFDTSA